MLRSTVGHASSGKAFLKFIQVYFQLDGNSCVTVWLISLSLNLGREEGSLTSVRAARNVESKGVPLSRSEGVVEELVNLKESGVVTLYLTVS